jgi:hypothetical protein
MLKSVALVRSDVSVERNAYIVCLHGLLRMLVTGTIPSSPILFALKTEAKHSSETSVLIRATRRNILEDAVLHSYRREIPKSYIALTGWTL